MGGRFVAIFRDAPVVFFGVVIGVALIFRLGVGSAREALRPDVVAPTFTTSTAPGNASASASASATATATASDGAQPSFIADPDAKPISNARKAEIGAAGRVQPIGLDLRPPSPARVAPKPRGHGRRPIR